MAAAKGKYSGSFAEHLWRRLDSMDFMNRGMLFAAVLFLCFFPFLIIVDALAGRSATTRLLRRLGLDQAAAAEVSHLFTSSSATSNAITGSAGFSSYWAVLLRPRRFKGSMSGPSISKAGE